MSWATVPRMPRNDDQRMRDYDNVSRANPKHTQTKGAHDDPTRVPLRVLVRLHQNSDEALDRIKWILVNWVGLDDNIKARWFRRYPEWSRTWQTLSDVSYETLNMLGNNIARIDMARIANQRAHLHPYDFSYRDVLSSYNMDVLINYDRKQAPLLFDELTTYMQRIQDDAVGLRTIAVTQRDTMMDIHSQLSFMSLYGIAQNALHIMPKVGRPPQLRRRQRQEVRMEEDLDPEEVRARTQLVGKEAASTGRLIRFASPFEKRGLPRAYDDDDDDDDGNAPAAEGGASGDYDLEEPRRRAKETARLVAEEASRLIPNFPDRKPLNFESAASGEFRAARALAGLVRSGARIVTPKEHAASALGAAGGDFDPTIWLRERRKVPRQPPKVASTAKASGDYYPLSMTVRRRNYAKAE